MVRATLCAVLLIAASATAQDARQRFTGEYEYDESRHGEVVAQITQLLAPYLVNLDPLMRMMIESRLDDRNVLGSTPVPERIAIAIAGSVITVRQELRRGRVRTWTSEDGRPTRQELTRRARPWVTQRVRDGQLEQVVDSGGADHTWYWVYRLDASGQRLDLRIALPPQANGQRLQIVLPYRRVR